MASPLPAVTTALPVSSVLLRGMRILDVNTDVTILLQCAKTTADG